MNGTDHTIRHVTVDKMRRKRLKVVSACQECRRKKTKCNGELPCMSCVKGNIESKTSPATLHNLSWTANPFSSPTPRTAAIRGRVCRIVCNHTRRSDPNASHISRTRQFTRQFTRTSHRIDSSQPPSSPGYHNNDRPENTSSRPVIQAREKRAYSESEDYGRHGYAGPEADSQPTRSSETIACHGYPAVDSIDSSSSSFRSTEDMPYSAFTPRGSSSSSPPLKGAGSAGSSTYRVRLPPIQGSAPPMSSYASSGSPAIRNLLNRSDGCTLPSLGLSRSVPPLLDTLEIDSPSPPAQLPNKQAYSDTSGRHYHERPTPRSPSTSSGFYRGITSPREIGTGSSS
ncbi:hypothetical protein CLU79DRAFT_722809 [Phycomyces nitens]|nr:hypothetical protein CLU79DRAFT_722809 [Phycomyces nitens]